MRPLAHPAVALLTLTTLSACGPGPGTSRAPSLATPVTEVLDTDGASLGSIALRASCTEPANASLRRGLALTHNMTYERAAAAYEQAGTEDPSCALAPWGVALTYVHPLWPDVPSEEQLDHGWALLQEARARGPKSTLEEGYISALEAYYRDGRVRNEQARLRTYAEGWEAVASAHPDDPEAALFRALSLMASNYGNVETQAAAGLIAEGVLEQIPDHPGAQHYVIHAYDLPTLADQALAVAHTYGRVAPKNSHALHMTSHIFTRVGSWGESIDYNTLASQIAIREPIGGRISHHYLHAIDYLVYAYLQRRDDQAARQILEEMEALDGPAVEHAASAYAFAAIPARIPLELHQWGDATRLEPRQPSNVAWEQYPHLEAITEFARALGFSQTGDLVGAERALARLRALHQETASRETPYDWAKSVKILQLSAQAWIKWAKGSRDQALATMREAAALEETHPKHAVTPGEVLPAGELLGDMLIELGRYEEARAAYEACLERSPNRFNSLFGAGQAAEAVGDLDAARHYYAELLTVVTEVEPQPAEVVHARGFVSRRGS